MLEKLEIEDIDITLLEKQRVILAELLWNLKRNSKASKQKINALEGVVNMLDEWSDARYRQINRGKRYENT